MQTIQITAFRKCISELIVQGIDSSEAIDYCRQVKAEAVLTVEDSEKVKWYEEFFDLDEAIRSLMISIKARIDSGQKCINLPSLKTSNEVSIVVCRTGEGFEVLRLMKKV